MRLRKFRKGKIVSSTIKSLPYAIRILLIVSLLLIESSPIYTSLITNVYADYKEDWGVLAVNTNKSIYKVGDMAKFEYSVLDVNGGMVCGAKMEMRLTNRRHNIEETFSTENGRIRVNDGCDKKEYLEIPDLESDYLLEKPGTYEIELTAVIAAGKYSIRDSFKATNSSDFDVERIAPTRIYPPENYPVKLKVTTKSNFKGRVVDKVPLSFEINGGFGYTVEEYPEENYKEIVWEVDWLKGSSYELSYEFNAPNKSPEFYELGKLSFVKEYPWLEFIGLETWVVFEEGRVWQTASDAANELILFWDDNLAGGGAPAGWTSISDAAETYENVFIRGAATPDAVGGGVATHNHTAAISNISTLSTLGRKKGTGTQAGAGAHTHTAGTATSVVQSNLPDYSSLMVIKSTGATTSIPRYAIALFETDPGGDWVRYSTQDGKYIYGGASAGSTGGNSGNSHTHNVTSITLTTISGTTNVKQGNEAFNLGSEGTHTHPSNDVTSQPATTEPPYKNALLYYPSLADTDAPTGLIAMFDTLPLPDGWDTMSGSGGDFENMFIKPSNTYSGSGGISTAHTHTGVAGGTSQMCDTTWDDEGVGTNLANHTHTHTFDIGLSELGGETYVPPYVDVVVAKYNPVTRVITQDDFEWFVTEDSETLTNAWPPGIGVNLDENDIFTQLPATNEPLVSGDKIRIQMNFEVTGLDLVVGEEAFELEYWASEDCTAVGSWTDVGAKASGSIWRLFDESSIGDSTVQVNNIDSSTVSAEGYYSEIIPSDVNPNEVIAAASENSEWDWPVENNGAAENTTYCFRMVLDDAGTGTELDFYTADSYPKLTTAPGTSVLMRHGNFFQDDSEKGFLWAN